MAIVITNVCREEEVESSCTELLLNSFTDFNCNLFEDSKHVTPQVVKSFKALPYFHGGIRSFKSLNLLFREALLKKDILSFNDNLLNNHTRVGYPYYNCSQAVYFFKGKS